MGLIVGLHAGTHSRLALIGGILTVAIADACLDALGIHIAQEAQRGSSTRDIWEATIATFGAKFVFALTFVVPILTFLLETAVVVSVLRGMLLLTGFNLYQARLQRRRAWPILAEHLFIASVVVAVTHSLGLWIERTFARATVLTRTTRPHVGPHACRPAGVASGNPASPSPAGCPAPS